VKMTTVELINLCKTYPTAKREILQDFSLTVQAGEMLALLGASGSGKSTLLKLVAGIEAPSRGDVHFDAKSILHIPPHQRKTALMFQKAYLFPFMTVGENVGFGLKMQGASVQTIRTEVQRQLDWMGLAGMESRKVGSLSGGEAQRVALARALILQPKVLLLDEPLSSLDSAVRLQLQGTIRKIQQESGITAIFVTHDLHEAMAVSDRMAILKDGQVLACDAPQVLFHHAPNIASARFVGVDLFLAARVQAGWLTLQDGSQMGENTAVGEFCADGAGWLAVRPEHICLHSPLHPHGLTAVILGNRYRGEWLEVQIKLAGTVTTARLPMPATPLVVGSTARVTFAHGWWVERD
jgi:ABC-type Fe3+/spermidine/putrescine transport system ATPase subunit